MIQPVEFQNAKGAKTPPLGDHFLMQPKLDGWRMAFYVDPDGVRSFTRTMKPQAGKTPALDAEFARIFPPGTVVDGEIVAKMTDDKGRTVNDFSWVAQVMGSGIDVAVRKQFVASRPMEYVAFDLLYDKGEDIRHLPYRERIARMMFYIDVAGSLLITAILSMPSSQATHDAISAAGYEGTVVKDSRSTYVSGARGNGWTKIKNQPTEDVVVMGFDEGNGKYGDTIGAIVFGQYRDGVLIERGRASGMNDTLRRAMGDDRDEWVGRVIEIGHNGKTKDAFRHPQYKGVRVDKPATDCEWS